MASEIKLTMDGMLLNWLKNVGDAVKAGEVIAEVEADKATVEVQAENDGVLLEQGAAVGDEIKEGTVIARVGAAGETAASAPASKPAAKPAEAPAQSAAPAPQQQGNGASSPAAATTEDGRIKVSPVARNMAEELGIDLSQVRGTGPGGRIVKADIENFKAPAAASPAAPAQQTAVVSDGGIPIVRLRPLPQAADDIEFIDVSRMRRTIASGTTESAQQIPHFYVTTEMDLGPLMALRKQINAASEQDGIKISVNDMIVKAAALALREFPNLNTHYYGEKLVRYHRINIGIAVAPPGGGVIYIVAKDADKLSLGELATTNKEMIDRARDLKLKPEDTRGATFSTSNLGPYDVEQFAAIINPPESGVLAIGSGRQVPVVQPDGTLGVGLRIKITISVDHRVSDGAEGAAYLQYLKGLIENPMRLLV